MSLSLALAAALLLGVVLGGGLRMVVGSRTHLGFAASVLSGIVGAAIGTSVVALVDGSPADTHPAAAILAAVAGTLLVLLAATALTRAPEPSVEELIRMGESARVEFKSSARFNVRTGQRDERLELMIAKTVAALANTDGGVLLIGVDDEGAPIGLESDYALVKQPDSDRYELWLRDFLAKALGASVTSSVAVSFPSVDGVELCRLVVPRASRPVFLSAGRSSPPEMWVRIGNSTRQLPVDEAIAYASDRWSRRGLRRPRRA